MKNAVHTESEMALLIEKWNRYDGTKKSFCQKHGISYAVFHYWHQKLQAGGIRKEVASHFVPVEVRTTVPQQARTRLAIKFADGLEVQVY